MTTHTGCPGWCNQSTPHGVHQSPAVTLTAGMARWTISLGQVDGSTPHVTVVYLGVQPSADAHWHLSLEDAPKWATFAARLGAAQVAAAVTTMVERAASLGDQPPERYQVVAALYEALDAGLAEMATVRP